MTEFEKKLKALSQDFDTPASYDKKVDETLKMLAEEKECPQEAHGKKEIQKKGNGKRIAFRIGICLTCIVCLLVISIQEVRANIFDFFKQTLMDFLQSGVEENIGDNGVESSELYVESKPDLMMELKETVIDSHNIYLLVKITAPPNITFTEDIAFEYFCFCKGKNYSVGQLLSGAQSCNLLEVSAERSNAATYIVNMVFEEDLEEGTEITAFFKDLKRNPYSDDAELLVEGMWSITFSLEQTVTESVTIEGNSDMAFPYIDTTAAIEKIELTPIGLVLLSDISNFPSDKLGLADTSISVKLEMIDGSEVVVFSHDLEEEVFAKSGSIAFEEENGKTYQRNTAEFRNVINLSMVTGIYVEDFYIGVRTSETE